MRRVYTGAGFLVGSAINLFVQKSNHVGTLGILHP